MLSEKFCLGDRVIIKRRLGMLEKGSVGIVLDIDSKGSVTVKMTSCTNSSDYVIVVNDVDVLEKSLESDSSDW